jgi:hypothetical protein
MKALFWIGVIVLVLGIASFFVPLPHQEREGIKAGGVNVGVEVRHSETVAPAISGILVAAGVVLMIAGARMGKRA